MLSVETNETKKGLGIRAKEHRSRAWLIMSFLTCSGSILLWECNQIRG